MLLFTLALAVAGTAPNAPAPEDYLPMYKGQSGRATPLVAPYLSCTLQSASLLEPSGDAPSEIALAAIAACSEARDDLLAEIDVDMVEHSVRTNAMPPKGVGEAVMSKLDDWIRSKVQMLVVVKRAERRVR